MLDAALGVTIAWQLIKSIIRAKIHVFSVGFTSRIKHLRIELYNFPGFVR